MWSCFYFLKCKLPSSTLTYFLVGKGFHKMTRKEKNTVKGARSQYFGYILFIFIRYEFLTSNCHSSSLLSQNLGQIIKQCLLRMINAVIQIDIKKVGLLFFKLTLM